MTDDEFSSSTTIKFTQNIVDPAYEDYYGPSAWYIVLWCFLVIVIFVFWIIVACLIYRRYQNRQHFVTVQAQVPVVYAGNQTSQHVTIGNPPVTSPYSPYPAAQSVNTSHAAPPPPPYSPYSTTPSALSNPPPNYQHQQTGVTNLGFSNPDLGSSSTKH